MKVLTLAMLNNIKMDGRKVKDRERKKIEKTK